MSDEEPFGGPLPRAVPPWTDTAELLALAELVARVRLHDALVAARSRRKSR